MLEALQMDPLAERVNELRKYELASVGPLLALADQLLDDARRQYDHGVARVLVQVRQDLVRRLEDAVAEDRWVKVPEAARIARRPEGTVRYWCRRGLVDARKIGSRAWEIDRESLLTRAAA